MARVLASEVFASFINQFDKFIRANYYLQDPYRSLVPRREFEPEQGERPTVVSLSGELPTEYPLNLPFLNITNGPGAAGDVVPIQLQTGQEERTYQLEIDAWCAGVINQSDQQFRKEPLTVIMNQQEMLANFTIARNADWHRVKNLGMIDFKVVITAAGEFKEVEDQLTGFAGIVVEREALATGGGPATITLDAGASALDDFYNDRGICIITGTGAGQKRKITDYTGGSQVATVGLAWTTQPDATSVFRILTTDLPTAALDWNATLPQMYNSLGRRGAKTFAIGMAGGLPVYSLSTSPEVKTQLFQADQEANIRYFDPSMNFTARGITTAMRGYMPNVDDFIPRLDACFNLIYPFENVAQTRGKRGKVKKAYLPKSQGGEAEYEVFTIMAREIYQGKPRPPEATNMAGAQFKPQNYTGEIQWFNPETINPATPADNKRHNKGYYEVLWSIAAKPERPENGYSGLQRIPSEVGRSISENIG